jgi:hypothetical protein
VSPIEWYYAKGDKQQGPVSSSELKQLAASGQLVPDDLVWREGMSEWVEARNVRGLFEGPPKVAEPLPGPAEVPEPPAGSSSAAFAPEAPSVRAPTPAERLRGRRGDHLFDMLLDALRSQFTTRFIDSTTRVFVSCGNFGLFGVMGLVLVFWLIVAVKAEDFGAMVPALIAVLVLAVLQYTGNRFCRALDRLNRTTSGQIQSQAFPDSFALINVVAGVGVLLWLTIDAIQSEQYAGIFFGLAVFVICQYLAFISLNLGCLNIAVVEQADAGEESIGVVSFLLKASIRLVPVAYGAGVVYAGLLFLYALYQIFAGDDPEPVRLSRGAETASSATTRAVQFGLLPFLGYLLFLLYYLSVAVVRAILSLPGKLDALSGRDKDAK